MKNRLVFVLSLLALLSLALTACSGAAPEPTATLAPTSTHLPTSTATTTPTLPPTLTPTPEPGTNCQIVSLKPVADAVTPTFEVEAEGYIPNEGRYIKLDGLILLGGSTQTFSTALMGGNGESADADGHISQIASLMPEDSLEFLRQTVPDADFPTQEITITVGGHESGCEVTQTIAWP